MNGDVAELDAVGIGKLLRAVFGDSKQSKPHQLTALRPSVPQLLGPSERCGKSRNARIKQFIVRTRV
jgi:hypothetical protein